MTETNQLRARYARMYTLGILTVLAVTVASAAFTAAPTQPAMDVAMIMNSIDTGSLPIQGHIDAI